MSFLAPLAFAFAAAIPVVICFYLLKRKRVVRLVSSTLLWQRFLAETQASAPFQRLRHNWLLVLQILFLALLVLSIARPILAGRSVAGRLEVVILDGSASMQSVDVKPSRFEAARRQALRLVDELGDHDQMVVLLAASTTRVLQSPTSQKTALRRALRSATVTDGPTRLREALKLAQTLIQNRANPRIDLFSDGAVPNLSEFAEQSLPLVFHKVGLRGDNAGIVNFEVRSNPENPAQRAIFTRVLNVSSNAISGQLELWFGGRMLESRPVRLLPGKTAQEIFFARQTKDGVFNLRLDVKDDLAVDNQAWALSLLPQPVKVLLVTRGNRFLKRAIEAIPNVELSQASDVDQAKPPADIVVLDNVQPSVWPRRSLLAIHVVTTNWFSAWHKISAPPIVDWKTSHPLLRFVDFGNVQVSQSLAVKTPIWAVPLVESPQYPLVLAGEINQQRLIWIGFDLLQSTWPLRISFPIFIANAVAWLNPASIRANWFTLQSGEPFRYTLPQTEEAARVTLPDRTTEPASLSARKKDLVFGDTRLTGVYHLRAGTNEVTFCVNLLDGAESDTWPRPELHLGTYTKIAATPVREANLEYWRWVAAVGLGVLMFEWWYYHRRTA